MADPRPPDWDWVSARAACSVVTMFERVRTGAIDNVAKRNTIAPSSPPGADARFAVETHHEGRQFTVFDTWGKIRRAVTVSVEATVLSITIDVPPGPPTTVHATLTLNDQGLCKFKVEDRELEPWQLLKLALERLFFQD